MWHLVSLFVVVAVVLLSPLAIVQAQESTPQATPEVGLPVEVLGAGPSSLAPGHGLAVAHATFPPGVLEPNRHVHPFDYVVAIESGSFVFTIEAGTLLLMRARSTEPEPAPLGEEITVGPGESFAGNPDVVWGPERVEGDEPVVAMLAILAPEGAPETQYLDATPMP
jgi:hypothetical protein